jgi:hypothetical protein
MRSVTLLLFGVLAVLMGINGLFHPDPTPNAGPPQEILFVVMVATGGLLLTLLAISAVREWHELRRIRRAKRQRARSE